ncbi:MAG: hydroxyisourate hydrolase [Acidimicrobiaceae bacterium]|nr:hydroxyisourate hydrolase [Acidimicrobiaceae bacterium]
MASLSTHVLDAAAGGPHRPVHVEVHDTTGTRVGEGRTDESGRIESLAESLAPGSYRITWRLEGAFVVALSATVVLAGEGRCHVPVLASDGLAAVYLGAV